MFEQLNAEDDITIVLVTHDAAVARHARRIIQIHDGVIEGGAFASELKPSGSRQAAGLSAGQCRLPVAGTAIHGYDQVGLRLDGAGCDQVGF